MTFLKENAKNCVKSLLFCRFVRVITRFDKEKEERSLKNQRTNLKTNLKLEFTKIKNL